MIILLLESKIKSVLVVIADNIAFLQLLSTQVKD